MQTFDKNTGQIAIEICPDRVAAGRASGVAAADAIKKVIAAKGAARVIFAAAPSQNEMLETLVASKGIDWSKVTAFHMDEYIGLPKNAPQRFAHYLKTRIFERVPFAAVHLLAGTDDATPESLCEMYTQLLAAAPIDIVCLGIGENGHIAFNDPPVADFSDTKMVKVVALDLECRQQQVNDGCFAQLDDVPQYAITLTIPTMMSASHLICTVLGERKRAAVHRAITGEISTECPATILRTHADCTLFVDRDCWGDADDFRQNSPRTH